MGKRTMFSLVVTCTIIYCAALTLMFVFQRNLLYFPEHHYVTPLAAGVNAHFKEMDIITEDGLKLKAWSAPATSQPFTIVFFHGNADNLRTAAFVAEPYINAGYGFVVAEYRGYSGLDGQPTENGLYADARGTLNALKGSGVAEDKIILFGQSLGTGIATQMATEFHAAGLMLLSPYMSMPLMAQIKYPVFPVKYLVKDRYESYKKIPNLHLPLLIGHGEKDTLIPVSQGQNLFALANKPKTLRLFPSVGHNDAFDDFANVSLPWLSGLAR